MTATLPIGFANDRQPDKTLRVTRLRWYESQGVADEAVELWLGRNCSACHTARMRHDWVDYTLEGSPSLVDSQDFADDLDSALHTMRGDPARWDRFAATVLDSRDTPANRAMLGSAFDWLVVWQDLAGETNETPLRYGQGRLDAGAIS